MKTRSNFYILLSILISDIAASILVVWVSLSLEIFLENQSGTSNSGETLDAILGIIFFTGFFTIILGPLVSFPAIIAYFFILKTRISQQKLTMKQWIFDGSVIATMYSILIGLLARDHSQPIIDLIMLFLPAGALTGYFTWRLLRPFENNQPKISVPEKL